MPFTQPLYCRWCHRMLPKLASPETRRIGGLGAEVGLLIFLTKVQWKGIEKDGLDSSPWRCCSLGSIAI